MPLASVAPLLGLQILFCTLYHKKWLLDIGEWYIFGFAKYVPFADADQRGRGKPRGSAAAPRLSPPPLVGTFVQQCFTHCCTKVPGKAYREGFLPKTEKKALNISQVFLCFWYLPVLLVHSHIQDLLCEDC